MTKQIQIQIVQIGEFLYCYIDNNKVLNAGDLYLFRSGGEYQVKRLEEEYEKNFAGRKIIATSDDIKLKLSCDCSESEAIYCGSKCQKLLPKLPDSFLVNYVNNSSDKFYIKVIETYVEPEGIHSNRGHFEETLDVSENNIVTIFHEVVTVHPLGTT